MVEFCEISDGHVASELRVMNKREQQRRLADDESTAKQSQTDTSTRLSELAGLHEIDAMTRDKDAANLLREQARTDLIKRRICEQNDELKALKQKLSGVLLNRERAAQLMEKDHRANMSKLAEFELDQQVFLSFQKESDKEMADETARAKLRDEAKASQLGQMAAREELKLRARAEYEQERAEIDQLTESLRNEEHELQVSKLAKAAATRAELHAYMDAQVTRREKRIMAEKLEIAEIRKFNDEILERETQIAREREERKKEKERVFHSISAQLDNKRKQDEELSNLINEIYSEELDAEKRKQERLLVEKQVRNKLEMLHNYDLQLEQKRNKIVASKFEQERVKKDLMDDYMRKEKIEQLNDQKRRAKMLEFNKELETLIEQKKQKFLEEQKREENEKQLQDESINHQHHIVEEERNRIIHEYKKFIGELPA